ncbi:hypothetical protein DYB35_010289 [Aphanomyces astaci]|uniref:Myb/SANT-like domain-containing protein n=1 Tax=Aphanomyces astaci TaxID=112090 RepID=A0A418DQ56_APHAT|nr:hypothetical protein DYB35_010289 [Aphanomyces astaci]
MKDSRATWSHARDLFLVTQLQAQADSGKRADNGFKKEAWRAVCNAFNLEYGVNYLPAQLKSRVSNLDCDVKYLRDNSGFGWDDALGLPTAPEMVWASITMVFEISPYQI